MPFARQRSATFRPASPSLTIARICSSVNLLRFIGPPLNGGPSFYVWRISGGTSFLPTDTVVVLNFSTEIVAPGGGTVNLDYSIDGGGPQPIGPEFFASDNPFFVTRTAVGATIPPFVGPLSAGFHTIVPFLTAFGGDGAAFF